MCDEPVVFERVDDVLYWASGEFMLKWRPNGGTVIMLRSAWTATLVYVGVLLFKEFVNPANTWVPKFDRIGAVIHESLSWYGAIFAAFYAGLYSRFSSQWAYLAGLYNQMQEAQLAIGRCRSRAQSRRLAIWNAAFIEDAEDLHLACKPMFAYSQFPPKPSRTPSRWHCRKLTDTRNFLIRIRCLRLRQPRPVP